MKKIVLDLSHWNTVTSGMFEEMAKQGIYGVILKAGQIVSGKWKTDDRFYDYYTFAKEAGLNVGAYFYCVASKLATATTEIDGLLEAIKGLEFELPVMGDYECTYHKGAMLEDIINYQGSRLEYEGYFYAWYANKSTADTVGDEVKKKYALWIAHWGKAETEYENVKGVILHQFSSSYEAIPGFTCDASYLIQNDLADIIITKGFNGFAPEYKEVPGCGCGCYNK